MVVLKVWYFEKGQVVCEGFKAPDYGKAFDTATSLGAWRAVDGLGTIWRKIGDEWVSM